MCVCLKKASCWAAVTVGLWQWCYQGSRHLPTFSTWQLSALGLHRPAALCGPSFALQQARIFASFSLEHGPFFSTLNPTSLNSFLDFHTFSRSFLWLKTAKKLSSVKIFPFFCFGPRPSVQCCCMKWRWGDRWSHISYWCISCSWILNTLFPQPACRSDANWWGRIRIN